MVNPEIKEKIFTNFEFLKNNFNNGVKEYKSFREVCKILDIDYSKASSDSKTSILTELSRYCDCGRKENSHRFVIRDIYIREKDPEKQTRTYHSVYANTFYCVIVKMIHDKSDLNAIIKNELVSDRYYLFNMFGLTNDWFYKPKEFDKLDEDIYNEVRDSCFEIAYQGFKRGLDYLAKKGKIVYSKCSLIHYLDNSTYTKRPATEDEEIIIQDFKRQILESSFCKSEQAFVQEYGFDCFKELLNKNLREYNLEYLSSVYRIALTNNVENEYENIYGEMDTNEIQQFIYEKRLEVNKKILAQLPAKNKYEFDNAYTHSTFRGHNYNERKNDIIEAIGKKIRKETGKTMISRQDIRDYYFEKRNEFATKIIEIT